MIDRTYNVLFICTGNSARSVIAEALMNELGNGRFKAFSAGSHPRGEVHPLTLELLDSQVCETKALRSKSWGEFAAADAPPMDFVFTVCDQVAGEMCPVWPGQPITVHWGLTDPAAAEGDKEQRMKVFRLVQTQIATRIRLFLSLPLEKIDRMALQTQLRDMGKQ